MIETACKLKVVKTFTTVHLLHSQLSAAEHMCHKSNWSFTAWSCQIFQLYSTPHLTPSRATIGTQSAVSKDFFQMMCRDFKRSQIKIVNKTSAQFPSKEQLMITRPNLLYPQSLRHGAVPYCIAHKIHEPLFHSKGNPLGACWWIKLVHTRDYLSSPFHALSRITCAPSTGPAQWVESTIVPTSLTQVVANWPPGTSSVGKPGARKQTK